jgi:hypothetical protein
MKYEKEKEFHISFCGSYCHICDWHTGKIRRTSQATLDIVQEYEGFKKLFKKEGVVLENLILGLTALAESGICPGCKADVANLTKGEHDRCEIRQCCSKKGHLLCSECLDFPCELLKTNPGVIKWHCIENLQEIKEKGLEQWIDNQWKDYLESSTST